MDHINNNNNDDMDSTKELEIPRFELIDDGAENIKQVEKELEHMYKKQNNKSKKKISALGKFNIFLIFSFILMVAGFIGSGSFWLAKSKNTPDLDIQLLANEKSSILLDKDDEPFFDLGMYSQSGEIYDDIVYNEMYSGVVDAFIAVEDSRFFRHKGFDIPRFTKAIFENISAGGFAQGGSTITMQLIKTSHLTALKSVDRKVQEINLSFDVEKNLPKEKILEYYVNKINYGAGNSRGLEGAAKYFFNKSANNLTLSESALLAGVINRPNAFSPINNLEAAYKRRNQVLDLMVYHGYIDIDEANLAKAVKIENQLTDEGKEELTVIDNPYVDYVNAVIDEVLERLNIDIVTTPMTIYTHLDRSMQEEISDIQNQKNFLYPIETMQSAIVVGDNETGALLALGGGRDSQVIKGRNRATRMFQQPGSVTKPLISYALAFEHLGWSTSHVVEDRPVQYAGTDKILSNFSQRYEGEVRLKDAVARSLNTPAYLTLMNLEQEISRGGVADYLHDNLGFTKVSRENYNTQYAIGGSTFLVSPAELFGAQAVMLNGGYYTKPHTVRYVETNEKEIIKDEFEYPKTRVISEETAYLVSVLEENNVSANIGNLMNIFVGKPYTTYAKTGTTDYGDSAVHLGVPVGSAKDMWMMSSTKKFSSVVWTGFDKAEAGKLSHFRPGTRDLNVAGSINLRMLDKLYQLYGNPGRVERPSGVVDIRHVISTFPYANPIEDMDSKYIVSGEINKKFLDLVDLDKVTIDVENVESFKAAIDIKGKEKEISLAWSEYPQDGAIKSETYDISLGNVKATGRRLFHPSWIFGPVKYKAVIYVDGEVLDEIDIDETNFSKAYKIDNDAKIKVCGFYGNKNQDGHESCVDLDNPVIEDLVDIPNFDTKLEVTAFKLKNLIPNHLWIEDNPLETSNKELDKKVASVIANGQDIRNSKIARDKLKELPVVVTYYKYVPDDED